MRRIVLVLIGLLVVSSGVTSAQEPTPPPAPAATPAPAAPAPAAPAAGPSVDSMKIICDGKVKANGEVNFVFTPAGAAPKPVRVTLMKGMSKSEVCRDVEKELSVVLGGAPYHVERYDDDKVKLEGKSGAKFSLSLGGQTATGVTIELK